jgi:hypothetical protein
MYNAGISYIADESRLQHASCFMVQLRWHNSSRKVTLKGDPLHCLSLNDLKNMYSIRKQAKPQRACVSL